MKKSIAVLCSLLLCALLISCSERVTPEYFGLEKSDGKSVETQELIGITKSGRSVDRGIVDSNEVEEWLSGFALRAKFVRNTGTHMDPDLKAPVTEVEFRVLEVCQGEFDGDILVTEYNGGTVSMKDYADVYGKDSVKKLGFGDLTDEELESKSFTDPYEGEDRFDFEKKDIDTEYLIFVTVNTETGKTWLGDNGLTCLEIKDGLVTNPFTGEAMTVDDMLNKN
ncbi:MAG: hypothetical protein IKI03_08780 [Clostridia bacterium]|nr:hypothetical protein [Clostridia bacterium]